MLGLIFNYFKNCISFHIIASHTYPNETERVRKGKTGRRGGRDVCVLLIWEEEAKHDMPNEGGRWRPVVFRSRPDKWKRDRGCGCWLPQVVRNISMLPLFLLHINMYVAVACLWIHILLFSQAHVSSNFYHLCAREQGAAGGRGIGR